MLIANIGNLVCPSIFDLGEHMKVAMIPTTEGEDNPLKYTRMFRAAGLAVINKIDLIGLAPHVDLDEDLCRRNIAEDTDGTPDALRAEGASDAILAAWIR